MKETGFTANHNQSVISLLAKRLEEKNKGRNRILFGAVLMSIVTFTMVFGIAKENSMQNISRQSGKRICEVQVLDAPGWEWMRKPAYTDIQGHYPEEQQEIMLPLRSLEKLGITSPKAGMSVELTVEIGLSRTEQETFTLCG